MDANPRVEPFFHPESNTWSYLVSAPGGGDCLVVDPVLDFDAKSGRTATHSAQAILDRIAQQGLHLAWVLETHAHADHLSAGAWLRRQAPGVRIGIGEGIHEVQRTFKPIFNLPPDFALDGSQFDRLFADGERLRVGALEVEVIATPGHTNDSVSYRIGDAVFVGDSLFMPDGGTARCDFPGGDAARLYRSIQRLYALPEDTRVFVCHDYGPGGREVACETTVGAEKHGNTHVRDGVTEPEYVAVRTARDATLARPALLLPAVQVNIRAGDLPPPAADGHRYLTLPLDRF